MSKSANIAASLKQNIGEDHGELVRLAYSSMDVRNDVTYMPNVKNEKRITTLRMNKIVKPFSSNFDPTVGAIDFSPRTVKVKVGKADLSIGPEDYRDTYLAQFMTDGVAREPEDLPFGKYILEETFSEFGQEVNDEAAYFGVEDPAGTDAKAVTNGYGKHIANMITAGDIVPKAIGQLDSTNAYDQLTALWRYVPEKYRKARFKQICYLSQDSYLAYQDSLDKKNFNNGRGEQQLGGKYLRGAEGVLELRPVSWMATSKRVFITPLANILMLADAMDQDLSRSNIVERVWGFDMGIACAFGFDFAYAKLIWGNEVA